MPISRRTCLGLIAGAASLAALPGRFATPARAAAATPKLRRGINIHNLLNWPQVEPGGGPTRYVWPPFQTPNYQIGSDELARLKSMGFDFVRLTVDPSIFIATEGDRRAMLNDMALDLVRRIQDAGFSVVFDLHPVTVNPDYAPRKLVAENSPVFGAYGDMVERLARELDGLPHDRTVFELMNEPLIEPMSAIGRWQPLLETLHARARQGSAELPLMLSGAMWSSLQAMLRLDTRPFRGSNVLYTFHYYDPHTFTHQGVLGDDAQYLHAVPWPMRRSDEASLLQAAEASARNAPAPGSTDPAKAQARTKELVETLVQNKHDPRQIDSDMAAAVDWGRSNGVPPERIVLGEFGCVAAAHGIALGPDRLRWIETVRRAAEGQGLPWAYWAYKGWGGMEMVSWEGQLDASVLAPLGLDAPS